MEINSQFDLLLTTDKVNSKYGRLLKKWRDNHANGKETTRTGNMAPNPSVVAEDPEMKLLFNYFAEKPGHGTDLGQGSLLSLPSHAEDEFHEDASSDQPRKRKKTSNHSTDNSSVAESLKIGMHELSSGFHAIAAAMTKKGMDESQADKKTRDDLLFAAINQQTTSFQDHEKKLEQALEKQGRVLEDAWKAQSSTLKDLVAVLTEKSGR